MARISGNDKLFRLDLADRRQDAADVRHARRCVAAVPRRRHARLPVDGRRSGAAGDARGSAQRQHLQPLDADLKSGELKQFTDTLTSNLSPVRDQGRRRAARVAFVTYYKGEYGIHTLDPKEAKATVASRDFGEPGPVIDFQAPLTHTLVQANKKKKGRSRRCSSTAVRRSTSASPAAATCSAAPRSRSRTSSATSSSPSSPPRWRSTAPSPARTRTCRGGSSTPSRASRRRSSTTATPASTPSPGLRPSSIATTRSPPARSTAARSSRRTRSTATPASRCRPASCTTTRSSTTRPSRTSRASTRSSSTARRSCTRARPCRSASR